MARTKNPITVEYQRAQAHAERNYNLRKVKTPNRLVKLFNEYLDTCITTVNKNSQDVEIRTFATKVGFYKYLVNNYGFKPQSVKRWFTELPLEFENAKAYINDIIEEYNTTAAGSGEIVAQVFTQYAKAKYEDYREKSYHEVRMSSQSALDDYSMEQLELMRSEFSKKAIEEYDPDKKEGVIDVE